VRDAIAIRGITKSFGSKVAVRDLDLVVPTGSLYGFIGPNGAGKTTTIRMIMSIIFPDRGELSVLGRASAIQSKDRIGYLPEERGLYRKMRVGAFLTYIARIKGVDSQGLRRRIMTWLERVELGDVYKKKCEELSKGMQQKVQFLASIIHEPELLILDEPFSGLDPLNMRLLRELILEQHRQGRTVIFSTHAMVQAEALCDRIFMIHNGRKVLDDDLSSIRARFDPRTVLIEPMDPGADPRCIESVAGVRSVQRDNGVLEVALEDGTVPADAIARLAGAIPSRRVEVRRPTLEDIFIQIVRGQGADERDLRASLASPVGGVA